MELRNRPTVIPATVSRPSRATTDSAGWRPRIDATSSGRPKAVEQVLRDRDTVGDWQRVDDVPFGDTDSSFDGSTALRQGAEQRRRDPLPTKGRRHAQGNQLVRLVAIARRQDHCDADESVTRNGAEARAPSRIAASRSCRAAAGSAGGSVRGARTSRRRAWPRRAPGRSSGPLRPAARRRGRRGWRAIGIPPAAFLGDDQQPGQDDVPDRADVSSERASARRWSSDSGRPAFGASVERSQAAAPGRSAARRRPSERASPDRSRRAARDGRPPARSGPRSGARPGRRRSRRRRSPASVRRHGDGRRRSTSRAASPIAVVVDPQVGERIPGMAVGTVLADDQVRPEERGELAGTQRRGRRPARPPRPSPLRAAG